MLAGGEFVDQVLQNAEKAPLAATPPLGEFIQRVARLINLPADLRGLRKRSRLVAKVRSVLCNFAVREMGISGEDVGRMLSVAQGWV